MSSNVCTSLDMWVDDVVTLALDASTLGTVQLVAQLVTLALAPLDLSSEPLLLFPLPQN